MVKILCELLSGSEWEIVKTRVLGIITTNTLYYVLYLAFGMVMLPVSACNSIKGDILLNCDKAQAISLNIKWEGSKII